MVRECVLKYLTQNEGTLRHLKKYFGRNKSMIMQLNEDQYRYEHFYDNSKKIVRKKPDGSWEETTCSMTFGVDEMKEMVEVFQTMELLGEHFREPLPPSLYPTRTGYIVSVKRDNTTQFSHAPLTTVTSRTNAPAPLAFPFSAPSDMMTSPASNFNSQSAATISTDSPIHVPTAAIPSRFSPYNAPAAASKSTVTSFNANAGATNSTDSPIHVPTAAIPSRFSPYNVPAAASKSTVASFNTNAGATNSTDSPIHVPTVAIPSQYSPYNAPAAASKSTVASFNANADMTNSTDSHIRVPTTMMASLLSSYNAPAPASKSTVASFNANTGAINSTATITSQFSSYNTPATVTTSTVYPLTMMKPQYSINNFGYPADTLPSSTTINPRNNGIMELSSTSHFPMATNILLNNDDDDDEDEITDSQIIKIPDYEEITPTKKIKPIKIQLTQNMTTGRNVVVEDHDSPSKCFFDDLSPGKTLKKKNKLKKTKRRFNFKISPSKNRDCGPLNDLFSVFK